MIKEILQQREQARKERDDAVNDRGVAGMRHALVSVVVERIRGAFGWFVHGG